MARPKRYVVCEGCQQLSLHSSKGCCKKCAKRQYKQARKTQDPEAHKLREARYRDANREKIRAQAVASYYRHHEKRKALGREYMLKRHYGLDFEGRAAMLSAQGGACKMCGTEITSFGRGASEGVVDHCHITGAVRGILCSRCNIGLGFVEKLGDQALAYLEATRGSASK